VSSPNPGGSGNVLEGVRTTSSTNMWAVGTYNKGTGFRTLALHCC